MFEIERIPEGINCFSKEDLVSQILSKSRASAKINRVCVFERIAVNGTELSGVPAFCIYIREETDPSNIHFGRQKLHYPMSLVFEDLNADEPEKITVFEFDSWNTKPDGSGIRFNEGDIWKSNNYDGETYGIIS